MIERCYDRDQGFFWVVSDDSLAEFRRKYQVSSFFLPGGIEISPGMSTNLLGYNYKPAEYVGLMKRCSEDRWSDLIFLLGDEIDLFGHMYYYDEVLYLQDQCTICQMTPFGYARNWVYKDGKWK